MIETHCHILPGVDDGCADMDQSIAMAQAYLENGVTEVVATSHFRPGMFDNDKTRIKQATINFNEELARRNIDLEIKAGGEYFWGDHVTGAAEDLSSILTFGDEKKYLLLEFNSLVKPINLRQFIFNLKLAGITPIMAHPERYRFVSDDLGWVEAIVDAGMLMQGTLTALGGFWNVGAKKTLKRLLDANLVQLIATDAHGPKEVGRLLGSPLHDLEKLVGESRRDLLVEENPRRVFEAKPLEY